MRPPRVAPESTPPWGLPPVNGPSANCGRESCSKAESAAISGPSRYASSLTATGTSRACSRRPSIPRDRPLRLHCATRPTKDRDLRSPQGGKATPRTLPSMPATAVRARLRTAESIRPSRQLSRVLLDGGTTCGLPRPSPVPNNGRLSGTLPKGDCVHGWAHPHPSLRSRQRFQSKRARSVRVPSFGSTRRKCGRPWRPTHS
jgi:hypothetical protein